MWEKFIHLLVDPLDGSKLELKNDTLISETGHEYNLIEDIPVLLNTSNQNKEFSGPIFTDFQYHDHYQKDAEYFDYSTSYQEAVTNFEQEMLHQSILLQIPKNAKIILDVGCGSGWVAKNLLPKNQVVISMDISSVNPIKAVSKYTHPNHLGLIADSLALPFRANTLDAIIGAEIMEHVVDPALFMQQLYQALKPGGKMILTTPYNEKIEYSLCIHCNKTTPRHAHLHSFHEKNIPPILPKGSLFEMHKFMNKFLLKLRTHHLFKYLPYAVWRQVDKFAEFCRPEALRFQIEISKPL